MFGRNHTKAAPATVALRTPTSEFIGAEAEAQPIEPRRAAVSDKDGVVVIGKGARVSGAISDCQVLDVYGVVEADVTAERLIVREGGGIRGSVYADNAEISGIVEGTLTAYEHLELNATGEVWAEVKYQTLAVAKGAILKGSIWLEDAADEHEQPSDAATNIELSDGTFASIGDDGPYKMNGKA